MEEKDSPLDRLEQICLCFQPRYLAETEYIVTCAWPCMWIGPMHERITEHLDDVWRATGARVRLSETSMSQPREFSVEIQGSLIGVYRAHCMLIRMYHEVKSFEEHMKSMFRGQVPDAV